MTQSSSPVAPNIRNSAAKDLAVKLLRQGETKETVISVITQRFTLGHEVASTIYQQANRQVQGPTVAAAASSPKPAAAKKAATKKAAATGGGVSTPLLIGGGAVILLLLVIVAVLGFFLFKGGPGASGGGGFGGPAKPDAEKIKTDLIGLSTDHWVFMDLSEFESVTVDSVTDKTDYMEYLVSLKLKASTGKPAFYQGLQADTQLQIAYRLDQSGDSPVWRIVSIKEVTYKDNRNP